MWRTTQTPNNKKKKTSVTTASGNRYTVLLSAAIVAYATHKTLKLIPAFSR
jgi:hypothetical protein